MRPVRCRALIPALPMRDDDTVGSTSGGADSSPPMAMAFAKGSSGID